MEILTDLPTDTSERSTICTYTMASRSIRSIRRHKNENLCPFSSDLLTNTSKRSIRQNLSLFSYLPTEITVNILTRLPINTIFAGKLVCKDWRDIINSDPIFAKIHNQASRLSLLTPRSMFILEGFKKMIDTKEGCDYEIESSKLVNVGHAQDLGLGQGQFGFRVLNSCRGFLFLEGSVDDCWCLSYSMYNPLTNEKVSIPGVNVVVRSKFGFECCGLGFNSRTNQYEAVNFIRESKQSYRISVYIIGNNFPRTDAWREVTLKEGYSNIVDQILWDDTQKPIELNGILHWKATGERILCFDLGKEELSLMGSPCTKDSETLVNSIGVFRGKLCLGIKDSGNSRVEMWVMKEYGVSESWMKYVVVKQQATGLPKFSLDQAILVDVLDNGEIIILCRSYTYRLLSYDPIKERFTTLSIPHYRSNLWVEVYVPGFLSIDNLENSKC